MELHHGLFVSLEGGKGCGKSTQIKLAQSRLEDLGRTVEMLREPGGTTIGEHVRAILLDPEHMGMDDTAELLLYEAARAQLVAERIRPALERGEVILCDRFFDSTTAYQGYARGLDLQEIWVLNMTATQGIVPDLTIVFDIDVETGVNRATTGGADRLEAEDRDFHQRVRDGFLAIAESDPDRVKVVDATGTIEEVHEQAMSLILNRLAADRS